MTPEHLCDRDVEAVVATTPESVFLLSGHLTWLGERMRGWMSGAEGDAAFLPGYAVLTRDGRVGLAAGAVTRTAAEAAAPDSLVLYGRACPSAGADDALSRLLVEMGLTDRTIGVEWDGAGRGLARCLESVATRDASLWLRNLRAVKTEAALDTMREAATATEAAMAAVFAAWTADADPRALRSVFRVALAERDCDFDHLVYGAPGGGVCDAVRPPEPVTALFFDAGARCGRYYSDTGTTLTRAGLTAADRERHAAALAALAVAERALRPGQRASSAWLAMQDEARRIPGLVAQGHGLGLGIREWPLLGPPSDAVLSDGLGTYPVDAVLAPGMVVNLEAGGHFADGTSVQIEKSFVIGADAAVPLAAQPRDVPIRLPA
ncbi:M24 family metallopeptidase [Methylorubrum thiocyanatum]